MTTLVTRGGEGRDVGKGCNLEMVVLCFAYHQGDRYVAQIKRLFQLWKRKVMVSASISNSTRLLVSNNIISPVSIRDNRLGLDLA